MSDRPRGYNADNRTDYVREDGSTQAMDAVLKDRASLLSLKGRKRMEAAFRIRAGMQAVLLACVCDYPLQQYETSSGHHEKCPSKPFFDALQRVAAAQEGARS